MKGKNNSRLGSGNLDLNASKEQSGKTERRYEAAQPQSDFCRQRRPTVAQAASPNSRIMGRGVHHYWDGDWVRNISGAGRRAACCWQFRAIGDERMAGRRNTLGLAHLRLAN